jgi:hypothetical protein
MLVVEDDVVLNEAVFKLSLRMKKVALFSVTNTVTSSVVVTFCDIKTATLHRIDLTDDFGYVLKQSLYIDASGLDLCETFVDLGEISAVDEYSN